MIARRSMLVIGLLALLVVHAQRPHAIQAAGNVVVTDCSNATQLHTAATSPGVTQITFDCGAAPATIPITGYMSVQGDVTIDGGGKVTLDGGATSPFFRCTRLVRFRSVIWRCRTAPIPAFMQLRTSARLPLSVW